MLNLATILVMCGAISSEHARSYQAGGVGGRLVIGVRSTFGGMRRFAVVPPSDTRMALGKSGVT